MKEFLFPTLFEYFSFYFAVLLHFANRISGFDHVDLDIKQENWHENMFPYKLGGYRKRLLTNPIGRRNFLLRIHCALRYAFRILN